VRSPSLLRGSQVRSRLPAGGKRIRTVGPILTRHCQNRDGSPFVTLGGSALEAAIYGLLFKAAAEATLTIAADPKRLGARSASPLCFNSWGSAMTHHRTRT
jgi:hypothetical protein